MTKTNWRHKGEIDKAPLHYPDCGLDDIYLYSGYDILDTPHGKGISVKNLDGLHAAIGCYLATQKKVLNGKELRFLRKQMDLTQGQLASVVSVNSQTVARWEKGETEIPGPADLVVRMLFIERVNTGSNLKIGQLSKELQSKDAPLTDRVVFEKKGDKWQFKKAA